MADVPSSPIAAVTHPDPYRYDDGITSAALQAARADALHALHHGTEILLVPNAWDAASARLFEQEGFSCIGTTSAGIAWSLGHPDGERIPRDEMLAAVARIVRATSLPVTADVEAGYGVRPEAVAETVHLAVAAGAVGVNLEDATGDPEHPLFDVGLQSERVAAAREAAGVGASRAFVNARTDVFWLRAGEPGTRVARAVERLAAYRAAGADGAFVPGVSDAAAIATLVREVGLPLNVLAGAGVPALPELARLGVARVSVGSALMRVAAGAAQQAARALRASGSLAGVAGASLSYAALDALMREPRAGARAIA